MSIDASASWMVRRTLRMRNRYEYHNNGYYFGIADTIADYTIGTGPRLQMLTKSKKLNRRSRRVFAEWAKETASRAAVMSRVARIYNGEAFTCCGPTRRSITR
jgi:hypothetical protein